MENIFVDKELNLAQHYYSINRYHEAQRHVQNVLDFDPNNSDAYFLLAALESVEGNAQTAIELIGKAADLGYDQAHAYYSIGQIYESIESYIRAEESYLEALKLEPTNATYIAEYAELMLMTGYDKKAKELLEESLRIDPNNENANQVMLKLAQAKSNVKEQLIYFQRVIDTSSDEVSKLVQIGLHHLLKKEYKLAKKYIADAFLLDPTNKDLLKVLKELDEATHWFFAPYRWIEKVGGPIVFWIIAITLIILLSLLPSTLPAKIFISIYFVYVIYSWTALFIFRIFTRGRKYG
jgi:tetratricopeptide (TPR) repeat protein